MVVFGMMFQVINQLVNSFAQKSDLNFAGTSVFFVRLMLSNNFLLFTRGKHANNNNLFLIKSQSSCLNWQIYEINVNFVLEIILHFKLNKAVNRIEKEVSIVNNKILVYSKRATQQKGINNKRKKESKDKIPRGKGTAVGFEIYNTCYWSK